LKVQASGIFRQLPTDARLMTDAAQAQMKMSAVHLPENLCSVSSCSRQSPKASLRFQDHWRSLDYAIQSVRNVGTAAVPGLSGKN